MQALANRKRFELGEQTRQRRFPNPGVASKNKRTALAVLLFLQDDKMIEPAHFLRSKNAGVGE